MARYTLERTPKTVTLTFKCHDDDEAKDVYSWLQSLTLDRNEFSDPVIVIRDDKRVERR